MALIFDAKRIGTVIMLSGDKIAGSIVRDRLVSISRGGAGQADGRRLGEDLAAFKAIITSVNFNSSTNLQLQHTLGNHVYINVFGDRIGQMRIGGIAIADVCGGTDHKHGITKVIQYYNESKASARPDPLTISLDSMSPFRAYLMGLQGGAMGDQANMFRMFQFSMDFAIPPT